MKILIRVYQRMMIWMETCQKITSHWAFQLKKRVKYKFFLNLICSEMLMKSCMNDIKQVHFKRQADICVEDEDEDDVEFPYFATKSKLIYNPQGASACNSDEEIVSDNEVHTQLSDAMQEKTAKLSKYFTSEADKYQKIEPSSFRGNRADGICTWLAANTEADADCASFRFHPVSSTSKRSCKGGQGKAKCKFSFRTQLHNDHLFQDEHDFSEGTSVKYNKTKSTSEQLADKKSILSISDNRYIDIEDDPDCLVSDSDSSSSEEEEDKDKHDQIQELTLPGPKQQKTIADQFHEALGSTNEEGRIYAVPVSRHTGFGLFGKLQRVMQREKERDLNFLSKLQKEDGESFFDVKILSKSLEGKLTVCSCSCSSIENYEERKNLSIIFSSRICSDVELDVGMMVRILPPWKEVNVRGNQEITNTILSTYFSQI